MYKLFNGTFNHILDRGSREALVHKLELFFPQYLQVSYEGLPSRDAAATAVTATP